MHASFIEHNERWPAPCKRAGRLLVVAAIATGLIILFVGIHLNVPTVDQRESAPKWMQALTLSAPALWPAGSPLRHPETLHPGVDLRHTVGSENQP